MKLRYPLPNDDAALAADKTPAQRHALARAAATGFLRHIGAGQFEPPLCLPSRNRAVLFLVWRTPTRELVARFGGTRHFSWYAWDAEELPDGRIGALDAIGETNGHHPFVRLLARHFAAGEAAGAAPADAPSPQAAGTPPPAAVALASPQPAAAPSAQAAATPGPRPEKKRDARQEAGAPAAPHDGKPGPSPATAADGGEDAFLARLSAQGLPGEAIEQLSAYRALRERALRRG